MPIPPAPKVLFAPMLSDGRPIVDSRPDTPKLDLPIAVPVSPVVDAAEVFANLPVADEYSKEGLTEGDLNEGVPNSGFDDGEPKVVPAVPGLLGEVKVIVGDEESPARLFFMIPEVPPRLVSVVMLLVNEVEV